MFSVVFVCMCVLRVSLAPLVCCYAVLNALSLARRDPSSSPSASSRRTTFENKRTLELKQFYTQRLRLCSSELMLNICSVIFEAIKLLLRVLLVLFIPEPSIAIALTCCFWYGRREKTRRQIRDHIRRRCRRRRRRTHTFNSMHLTRMRVKQ